MASKEAKKSLEGIYKFLSEAYEGNWQNRWEGTPYFKKAIESGKTESVVGHVWGAMEFWFQLGRVCPKLDSLVDTLEVYEILLSHDLGETRAGDVPLYWQVRGKKDNKEDERKAMEHISRALPEAQQELLSWFDEFEADVEGIDRLEILVAKWIDNLQGNHFVFTFGKGLLEHSEPIRKILQIRFVPYTKRLMGVLKERGEGGAVSEVRLVAQHHTEVIKAAGIDFDASKLETQL